MDNRAIIELEKSLKIKFKNNDILQIAVTHSSYGKTVKDASYNERLEFLGDSVLQLTITEYLFNNLKHHTEGELTKLRSLIVCESSLYAIGKELELGQYIRMSKGEELTGGRERTSIIADCVEAVIAAIYLDRGLEIAKEFILSRFKGIIVKAISNKLILDNKTALQEYLQKNGDVDIKYEVLRFEGPPHRRKFFTRVYIEGKNFGDGEGYSKKEAEQNAAKKALIKLGEIVDE